MRIAEITIRCFRSIKGATIVPGSFNIFVGQNNHGKTNMFEAMDWFYGGLKKADKLEDICFGRKIENEIQVEVRFLGAQLGAEKIKNKANKTKIKEMLGESDEIVVRRTSAEKARQIFVSGEWKNPPTGFDNALNDFLPKFEYVDTRKYFDEVAKFGKNTPVGVMLSGVLSVILEENEKYQQFRDKFQELFSEDDSDVRIALDSLSNEVKIYLEKQFPDCTRVKFEVSPPIFEDLLKNFETMVNDGIETVAADKGDGMQRALMLAIIQAYADFRKKNKDAGKPFLFFIDEAELHLHPRAQRNLKNALLDISARGDQVFLNTHSSVLVADDAEEQSIFTVEKISGKTNILPADNFDKINIIYELLGGSPSDLLLPRNFIIVEGRSEFELFSRIAKRFYPVEMRNIQIVYAGGDSRRQRNTMDAINTLFIPLFVQSDSYKEKIEPLYKNRIVLLCDTPKGEKKQNAFNKFEVAFPYLRENGQLLNIPQCSLEEYYPEPWKKTTEEAEKLGADVGEKVRLAKEVGDKIEKEVFEKEMSAAFEAIKKCWELAFGC
jgi:putative ATP-dependent endonuclease of the OLD family